MSRSVSLLRFATLSLLSAGSISLSSQTAAAQAARPNDAGAVVSQIQCLVQTFPLYGPAYDVACAVCGLYDPNACSDAYNNYLLGAVLNDTFNLQQQIQQQFQESADILSGKPR